MESSPADLAYAALAKTESSGIEPRVAVAPGRVNLIGEHTDYNGGYVLPMAINMNVAVAFSARTDDLIRGYSATFGESREARIGELRAPGGTEWFDYVCAVAWAMREADIEIAGTDIAVAGNVPVGAGLASSAALEMAVARAIAFASNCRWDPEHMASICQRAENSYVGVNCGIMDQFAASVCERGSALLLDCRSLEHATVPIPDAARFVVMDTGVRRKLAASEYNARRQSCETAVEILRRFNPNVRSFRDVGPLELRSAAASMDEIVLKRATHVANEIHRPLQMADALRQGDLDLAGRLMDESHASLRDLYEVSCEELDLITEIARRHEACVGARMTGAGFGGCAVALVARDGTHDFVDYVAEGYSSSCELEGAFNVCVPSAGASILP